MKQWYVDHDFKSGALALIATMSDIIDDYVGQGYRLTARQLYYQLVARDAIPNTENSYKRITGMINDAKLAGLLDWDAIEDRTREFSGITRWSSPYEILRASAVNFHMDMWHEQHYRLFAVVEKEALAGVLLPVCEKFDTPLLAARGYPSGTVLREFVERDLAPAFSDEQEVVILHLGDHDPSGIDMTRDLTERIELFATDDFTSVTVRRIALNYDQIKKYRPPPNPAKMTDSRFANYVTAYGKSSWELDALTPSVLSELVVEHANQYIDSGVWAARKEHIEAQRERIHEVADTFFDADS